MDPQMQSTQRPPDYYQPQEGAQAKGGHLQDQQHAYQGYEPYPGNANPPPPPSGPTILNITRGVALGVLALTVFLLVAAIGLGAGLGVSQRDLQQAKGDLEVVQAAFSSALAAGYVPLPA